MSLGIDIGLKNLSLCIIHDKHIKLWETYNIIEDIFCIVCGKNAKYVYEKKNFCGIHSRKLTGKKVLNTKIKFFSLQDIASKIINKFEYILKDNKELFNIVNLVTLELQPRINAKMKFTSHILFCLLCKFYIDKTCKIKFEKASIKLKNFKQKRLFDNLPNTYKNRKIRAIDYTLYCLNNSALLNSLEYLNFFKDKKKKDDLSDSFLLSYNNIS